MNELSNQEREQRALDALIVSQLRLRCDDPPSPCELPELTDEEKKLIDSLGDDFVDRLLKEARDDADDRIVVDAEELVCAGEDRFFGMNRADDVDEVTEDELERKRREVIDRVKREENDGSK